MLVKIGDDEIERTDQLCHPNPSIVTNIWPTVYFGTLIYFSISIKYNIIPIFNDAIGQTAQECFHIVS